MAIHFRSRVDAAHRLVRELLRYRGRNPLILAIPRGAVPMGRIIADELVGDLDGVLVRKLRSPINPELAVGSIDETGWTYLAPFAGRVGADAAYLEQEKLRQLDTLRERRVLYTPDRPPLDAKGRIAIVVDDGLATGATMIAALHATCARGPQLLVCAVPVAAPDSLENVRPYADEVVCLEAPDTFYAVAQFYGEFHQVEDDEVVALLEKPAVRARQGTMP